MIKVAIAGADTPLAGELLRILVNHPEVDIIGVHAPGHPGVPAKSIHHGLIGEATVPMVDNLDLSKADLLITCDDSDPATLAKTARANNIKVIDAANHDARSHLENGFVYGLSEIYRKPLVRGALMAFIPHSTSSMALVSLYPLASHLLLNSEISAIVSGNKAFVENPDILSDSSRDTRENLTNVQKSFSGPVTFSKGDAETRSGLKMEITTKCSMKLDDLIPLYEELYDDHNFTFLSASPVEYIEVEGTDKCIVSLSKPDPDTLRITTVADATMRGGAGETVHVMNLLFGLHEKTGLTLKANSYPHPQQ